MNKQTITTNTDLPAIIPPSLPDLMPPAPSGPPASVDISTMRQMPWIDFTAILDNTEVHLREQVTLDILQNNLPKYSGDDLYYIHHDPENNVFSIKIDETAEEIQDFVGNIMLINAQLKVETLSAKERERLIKKRKLKIKELRKTYNAHAVADVLEKKLSESEKKELEEEIVRIMTKLNSESDRYYFVFNENTQEYEIRLEENDFLLHDVVAALIKLTSKIENVNTPQTEMLESMIEREQLLRWLESKGATELANSFR